MGIKAPEQLPASDRGCSGPDHALPAEIDSLMHTADKSLKAKKPFHTVKELCNTTVQGKILLITWLLVQEQHLADLGHQNRLRRPVLLELPSRGKQCA